MPFGKTVSARYFKFMIKSNYRGGEMSGLAEVRFSNADEKAVVTAPGEWKPTYPRPQYPALKLGQPLEGAENIVFPADAGVVGVTKPPFLFRRETKSLRRQGGWRGGRHGGDPEGTR